MGLYETTSSYYFDDILFESRVEAEDVLSHLVDLTIDYGVASVADFYDLSGIESQFTDNKYGWTNLRDACTDRVRNGYIIRLPQAKPYAYRNAQMTEQMREAYKVMINSVFGLPRLPSHLRVKDVIFNDPATIVFWEDGTKTVVKAVNEDFDPEKGLAMAFTKKALGNQGNYFNHLKKWLTKDEQPKKSLYKVGESFTIDLGDLFGKQTATVQEVKQNGAAILLFDNILTERPINSARTSEGGFDRSDLNSWLHDTLLPVISKDTGANISDITLPTYGQIFDQDDWPHNTFVPDQDEQWPLMKKERRAKLNGEYDWYWLKNATRKEVSAALFARVGSNGHAGNAGASTSHGVRPCFTIEPLCGEK